MDDAVIGADSVLFKWRKCEPEISRYLLEISTDSLMTNAGVDSMISDTTAIKHELTNQQTYYWRVKACNKAGWGPFSEPRRFSVAILPDQVLLVSPSDKAVIGADSVIFKWRKCEPEVNRYWFEISTDSLMTNTIVDYMISDTIIIRHEFTLNQTYYWRVKAFNEAGWGPFSETYKFTILITGIDEHVDIPKEFALHQNFPNPFNAETTIKYQLPKSSHVNLIIYNVTGEIVRTLMDKKQSLGYYSVRWDGKDQNGRNVASGIYFYKFETPDVIKVHKLILMK